MCMFQFNIDNLVYMTCCVILLHTPAPASLIDGAIFLHEHEKLDTRVWAVGMLCVMIV